MAEQIPVPCRECGAVRWVNGPVAAARTAKGLCRPCYRAQYLREIARPAVDQVDEMAVQALLSGRPVRTTRPERQVAVTYLTDRRESAARIAERLRISQRTVTRLRRRQRQEAS